MTKPVITVELLKEEMCGEVLFNILLGLINGPMSIKRKKADLAPAMDNILELSKYLYDALHNPSIMNDALVNIANKDHKLRQLASSVNSTHRRLLYRYILEDWLVEWKKYHEQNGTLDIDAYSHIMQLLNDLQGPHYI